MTGWSSLLLSSATATLPSDKGRAHTSTSVLLHWQRETNVTTKNWPHFIAQVLTVLVCLFVFNYISIHYICWQLCRNSHLRSPTRYFFFHSPTRVLFVCLFCLSNLSSPRNKFIRSQIARTRWFLKYPNIDRDRQTDRQTDNTLGLSHLKYPLSLYS